MPPLTAASPLTAALDRLAQLRAHQLRPSSRAAYLVALRRLEPLGLATVGDLGQLRPKAAQQLVEALQRTYAPATTSQTMAALKSVWRYLHREELVTNAPFVSLEPINVGDNVPAWNVLRKGELDRLLAAVSSAEERALLVLLGRQGLRVHEALALMWGQVQVVDDRRVLVFTGKGGKRTRLGLRRDVWTELVQLPSAKTHRPTELVLPYERSWAWKRVCALTKQHLGHRVTPHGLRATFVSTIIDTHGIEEARQAARHASISTTVRYSRWGVLDVERLFTK